MADQEPRTGPPTHQRTPKSGNKNADTPLGLKPGLLGGVGETLKLWLCVAAMSLGLFFVVGILYGLSVQAGILTTEGTGAWVGVLTWIGSVWVGGQWLKARFGRPNKLFQVR